jgi:hypothetical protein
MLCRFASSCYRFDFLALSGEHKLYYFPLGVEVNDLLAAGDHDDVKDACSAATLQSFFLPSRVDDAHCDGACMERASAFQAISI